jgi:hypothetical protein
VSARFNRTVSSFTMRVPDRAFGTVVILSSMSREALFNPLRSVGPRDGFPQSRQRPGLIPILQERSADARDELGTLRSHFCPA